MVSQEDIMKFFYTMKEELSNEGYFILNNIKYEFKDYKSEEELIQEEIEEKMKEEIENYELFDLI